jgi:hypothetical protein
MQRCLTTAAPVERIDELRSYIVAALPVDRVQYPSLPDEDVVAFCVKHSALHFSKTSGQLAALAESIDHGRAPDLFEATKIVANSLVNAFKLAEELSISTESIVAFVHDKYPRI